MPRPDSLQVGKFEERPILTQNLLIMPQSLIFFHGGGSKEDFEADAKLVNSLKQNLGPGYDIHYPQLPNNGTPDLGRRQQINDEIAAAGDNVILVGHSLGASMLLACLSETKVQTKIKGIFLLATPYWQGNEDWVEAFKLKKGFAAQLDKKIPTFFYHSRDDEEVAFTQLKQYREQLPWATFREMALGGHQMNNDLTLVADDIRSINSPV